MTANASPSAIDLSIDHYLECQRALGRVFRAEEDTLRSLSRSLGSLDLDLPTFDRWCASDLRLSANVRRNRQRIARNWCLYRRRT